MKNRIPTQSELAARVSGLVAADLLRQLRRGRSLADRPVPVPGCAGDLPALPVPDARAVTEPAARTAPSAEELAVTAALRHSVDLYLLACEPFPGAAGPGDGVAAWEPSVAQESSP